MNLFGMLKKSNLDYSTQKSVSIINFPLLIIDTDCMMCNAITLWILKHEEQNKIKFTSSQSAFAKHSCATNHLERAKDTVIFIENSNVYFKSDAILQITKTLRRPYKYLFYLSFIPKSVLNFFYDIIANNRQKISRTSSRNCMNHHLYSERIIN
jgi:predicted DCC family thiol-disulfide oxidoreductase YuxK